MTSWSLAEDAVQDVLARMFMNLRRYQPIGTFASWLACLTHHWCANQMRSLHRQWR